MNYNSINTSIAHMARPRSDVGSAGLPSRSVPIHR
jgi:hypothetical protein